MNKKTNDFNFKETEKECDCLTLKDLKSLENKFFRMGNDINELGRVISDFNKYILDEPFGMNEKYQEIIQKFNKISNYYKI